MSELPKLKEFTSISDEAWMRAHLEWLGIRKNVECQISACSHCDGECGSAATYAGQACLPLNGRVRSIDWCIHQIVAALNAGGVETVASCCGHGKQPGRIDLADGRVLHIGRPT